MGLRSSLYKWARLLGDLESIKRGRVGKRITRRVVGRAIGRKIMRKI